MTAGLGLVLPAQRRLEMWNAHKSYDGLDGRFEAVDERHTRTDRPLRGRALLAAAAIECRHERRGGLECASCPHLLNVVPDPDRSGLTIRCVYFDNDAVNDLMTPATALVTIAARDSVGAARALLARSGVSQLIVTRDREVVGLVSASALDDVAVNAPVETACPPEPVRSIPSTTPLAVVARLFRTEDLALIIVTDDDNVAGVVSRGDMRRAGIPRIFLDRTPANPAR